MKLKPILLIISSVLTLNCTAQAVRNDAAASQSIRPISFNSLDGLQVEADYYTTEKSKGIIVLCHQANYSRGEYKEIAPRLIAMGYDCLAIDQRSGREVNNVTNKTALRALALKKETAYINAEQDIIAAVRWAKKKYADKEVILWGSSYSSSLVLKVAQNEGVHKVLSFSPGEYFRNQMTLKEEITELSIPVFVTCAQREIERTQPIVDVIPSKNKTFFKPKTEGNHGSKALWKIHNDHEAYWEAVTTFLNK